MKQFIILVLIGAVGYLLYDKFCKNDQSDDSYYSPSSSRSWGGEDSISATPVRSDRSAGTVANARNISLAKMEHPETMTDDERRLAEEWEGAKPRYFAKLDQIKTAYAQKSVPPYRFNARYAEKLQGAIRDLENAVNYDDFLVVPERCDAATDALRRFESSCSWQAGVSRGNGTHMHSGYREGSWEPDNGYTLVNRGGQLAAMQVSTCRNCRGVGYLIQKVSCPNCNGRGRVANPMAQIGDAMNLVGGILGAKKGRRMPNIPRQKAEIPCSSCNNGRVEQRIQCPNCNGQGKVYH